MNSIARLYGLVLGGGKSTRMGYDKSGIVYHDVPQAIFLNRILATYCEKSFISIREDQQAKYEAYDLILDTDEFRGPFNGILSAHQYHPEVAWLVLACDLPLINEQAITELIEARNPDCYGTAYASRSNPLPEPLIAIWEPKALAAAIAYLKQGNSTCPRKFLINNEAKLVFPSNENYLINANAKEDYLKAIQLLKES